MFQPFRCAEAANRSCLIEVIVIIAIIIVRLKICVAPSWRCIIMHSNHVDDRISLCHHGETTL